MFVLPSISFALIGIFLFLSGKWSIYGIPPMGSLFEDLQSLTATVSCSEGSSLGDLNSPTCDPFGRPFNYPTVWVKIFSFFHLTFNHTHLIGYVFTFLIFCVLLFWGWYAKLNKNRITDVLVFTLFSISAPVYLLVERGNIDTIILSGLTIISILLMKKRYRIAGIFIAILSGLKIYPLGAFLLILESKILLRKMAPSVILAGIFLFSILGELKMIRDRTPFNKNYSFGIGVLPQYLSDLLNLSLTRNSAIAVGVIFLCIMITFLFLSAHKYSFLQLQVDKFWNTFANEESAKDIFVLFAGIYIFSYTLGTNYDYRLVILLPLVASIIRTRATLTSSRVLIWSITSAVFLSFSLGKLSIISDVVFELLTIILTFALLKRLQQNRIGKLNS